MAPTCSWLTASSSFVSMETKEFWISRPEILWVDYRIMGMIRE
jgi:hypothetical protein